MFSLPDEGIAERPANELAFIEKLPAVKDGAGAETDFQAEIYHLAKTHHLTTPWLDAVSTYVLYDDFFLTRTAPLVEIIEMADVVSEQEEREDNSVLESIADDFPVGIFISPYATGRDIIDVVKERYKSRIEPIQRKYSEPEARIGRVRKRGEQKAERDAFIWKHRDLPASKLSGVVFEQFGEHLSHTYINKIKKRKEENK